MPRSTEATEVTRTISEVAQKNVSYAQRALSFTSAYLSEAPKLWRGGASDMEAMLKTGFGLQSAISRR